MIVSPILNYRILLSFLLSLLAGMSLLFISPVFDKHPQILLVLPAAGAFFLMLVINPRMTFALIFLIRPTLDNILNLTKVSVGGQDIGFGAVLNLIIIMLAVFLFFYEGGFPRKNPAVRIWVIFLVVMLAATIYSPYIGRAVRVYANYLSYFAMFLTPFLIIKNKKDFHFWLKVFACSFILPVLFADIDLLRGGQFYQDAGNRIRGNFSHPNILAFYLSLGITFYFYLLKSGVLKINRLFCWAMIGFMFNMLILLVATKTRNAWIACLGGFFIYALLKDRKFLLMLLVLMPAMLFVPSVKDRVVTVFNGKGAVNYHGINSFEWRLRMWKSSMPKIAQRPIQGYGLTSFIPMSTGFSDVGTNGAHNIYVETLFESGIIGLLSLLGLFLTPLVIFVRFMNRSGDQFQARSWAVVIGYLISYIVICSADNLGYYLVLNWYVWFFIGLMMVAKKFAGPSVEKKLPVYK